MKFRLSLFITVLSLHSLISKAQNTFPTAAGTYAGIGVTTSPSPSTALHIRKDVTTLSAANFITIENRGANAQYPTSHIIGGMLFSGYRDIRLPANVAGIWAVRGSQATGLSSSGDLVFGTTSTPVNIAQDNVLPDERMRITYDGKVGIGTATPNANSKLNVDPQGPGTILLGNPSLGGGNFTSLQLGISAQTNGYSYIQGTGAAGSSYGFMVLNPFTGNVLIGKTTQSNASYVLDVNGAARANKVVVNTTGADFVFDSTYDLRSLDDVAKYINQNKHLPDIATAAEMQKEGLDLGDNQTKLLQKVEELTLYLIQQKKEIELLKKEIIHLQQASKK